VVIPTNYVDKCSIFYTNAISASNGWSSWLERPFTVRTSIPTFSIYAGNVQLAPGISLNRRKLPSTRGCYLRSCGATYILIMPSTFWVSTGTKYPCIHATQSVSAKSTIKLLEEEDFAHFSFPHTVVTDCAATFKSDEFQEFCEENAIAHLTGAPYHPATSGAAERLVQTLKKSDKAPKDTLQDFLLNYRHTPINLLLAQRVA